MSGEALYQLDGAVKAYGPRVVCRIEHLEVRRGEVLGIVGPNGAGKSTLLRLLNFLEPLTSGRLRFQGQEVNGKVPREWQRRITMVFQEPILLTATVAANVAYGLKVRGVKDVEPRVARALDMVGLAPLGRAPVATLSGGEARRVALARALTIEPQVLLLDEPTANLDPYNAGLIEGLIGALNRERGTTIVLVTHNVFQARRLAHRVALLWEGEVVEVGPAQEVFARPRDPRAAAFLRGEMAY